MAATTAKDKGNIVWLHPTDVTLHLDGVIVGDEKSSTLTFPCISVVAGVPVGYFVGKSIVGDRKISSRAPNRIRHQVGGNAREFT